MNVIKTFTVNFEGVCPVGNCLVINAYTKSQAFEIAKSTIAHTEITYDDVIEFQGVGVVEYLSGDY